MAKKGTTMPDNEDQAAAAETAQATDIPSEYARMQARFEALEDAVAAIAQKVGVAYSPVRD